ncbi:hypothetical protein [Actinoplanes sp. L3-i22]|uniref:hypothetical protein n=1 Tax=Actinoplanes sp. L3-i22 TaxID=2836373 RepID=UPI001C851D3A|nr:hypothetical protein [Actinoplanes sp. L3-i22]
MSDEVDQDEVAWAQAVLVKSRASAAEMVQAYRILAAWKPQVYGLRLAGQLHKRSWNVRTGRMALLEEAVTVGRSSPLTSARDVRRYVEVLDSYQSALYEAGRRAEGFDVCAELGRLARRADDGSLPGLAVWARCLAESGRHAEAADACAELMVQQRPADGSTWSGQLWGIIRFVAQAHAAGRFEQAHAVLADAIEVDREFVDRGEGQERVLVHLLVYQAWMLRADGCGQAAAEVERDALAVLGSIVRAGGERKVWSGYQSSLWSTLLAASSVTSERDSEGPLPAFGWSITDWSPDLRETYSAETAAIAGSAAALTSQPELALMRRELAVRTAVRDEWRSGTRWAQRCASVFDESVVSARRCHDSGDPAGAALLAQALTDRAGLAAADSRFEAANDDLTEALRTRTEQL